MENIFTKVNRGKLEIKNSEVKCFLGNDEIYKSSEDVWNELKDNELTQMESLYIIGDQKFQIIYPINNKKISIITSEGKLYKSTVYFIDDIKNIIQGLNMVNPCYYLEGKYRSFESENDYGRFLYERKTNEIKDIKSENIDFEKLKITYNSFNKKKSNILKDINKNIYLYSKIDNIGNDAYFLTIPRNALNYHLNDFYENKKRDEINDIIFGIFGNYASGKSFFLIHYNYQVEFPSVYLNLKSLKNAFRTEGFPNLLNDELMTLFHKLNKSYDEFKNFISKFLPYQNQEFANLIISIINEIKKESALIILDQYQEEIFNNKSFIKNLKNILFNKNSKIKTVISSSMNDGSIREVYLNIILNNINNTNENKENEDKEENDIKTNNYIPYHYMEKLVDESRIKENIKKAEKQNDKILNDYLKLFNYLPLYYNLCRQYHANLNQFVEKTKIKIEDKILKINKNEKFNLKYFDNIRKMIDNEITVNELNFYSEYIPFKYFYIEKTDSKMILRTHFPLVKDAWNNIIMRETVNLFDGELKYDGNVIGSLMELNLIINIKNKEIPLDIDNYIKVDTICSFGKIIESDTDDIKNKNIFITQNNQNGPYFDIAYVEGKNLNSPKLIYIQVKKSLSENKINKQEMYKIFEESKNNFNNLFNFIPEFDKINLIYISLYNDKIKQAFISHDIYKRNKSKKVSDLGKINEIVYSINYLDYFCQKNDIQLYYYEPKKHLFYIKNDNNFEVSKLDFSIETKNEFKFILDTNYLLAELQNNKSNCVNINLEYENYLKRKRKKSFSYKINEFDMNKVFEFTEKYFNNINIIDYIDLNENHLIYNYKNLSNSQAIICFKLKNKNKEYEVDSFIYKNNLIKYENDTFKLMGKAELGIDNDFLVVISFESIQSSLKIFLSKNQ